MAARAAPPGTRPAMTPQAVTLASSASPASSGWLAHRGQPLISVAQPVAFQRRTVLLALGSGQVADGHVERRRPLMHPDRALVSITRPPQRRLDLPTQLRCPSGAGGEVVLVGLCGHRAPPWVVAVRRSATRYGQHGSHPSPEQDKLRLVLTTTSPPATGGARPPWWSWAGTGLACGAARGNPAPARGPAGCLLDGRPPGETRSPGAGEEQRPTSRQQQHHRRPP